MAQALCIETLVRITTSIFSKLCQIFLLSTVRIHKSLAPGIDHANHLVFIVFSITLNYKLKICTYICVKEILNIYCFKSKRNIIKQILACSN